MIRKFLLVDDDQDDTDLFAEALLNIDPAAEFHAHKNGKDVIRQLKAGDLNPEIIFLDINMPEVDGWNCLEQLKGERQLKDIPVVMYSTSPVAIDGQRALDKGALCFLEKPLSFKEIERFLKVISAADAERLIITLRNIEAMKEHRLVVQTSG